jgi:prepilin peptidase CpaA
MASDQVFFWSPWLFGCWCLVAMASDLVARRIPNWLTYPGILLGLSVNYISEGQEGALYALSGMSVALPFVLLFVARMVGGGDVKFMAGVGAWLGFSVAINVALTAVLLGAALGAIVLIWQGRLLESLRREVRSIGGRAGKPKDAAPTAAPRDLFPFGVPLGISALFWMGLVLG